MKLLSSTAAMFVVLTSVADTCLSQTLVKGVKYPEASSAHLPSCYIETSDNRILDLTKICASADADSKSTATNERRNRRWSRAALLDSGACDNPEDEFQERSCRDWEAHNLPGAPY